METIENAIAEFKRKRLAVYSADREQMVRDTRAAERATRDHSGRWLFELLQNSDDAQASQVHILIENGTVYIADDGRGFHASAVSAISGTDFSDKTTGTIGRKGLGFKSVYEVSSSPAVLTVNGEGIGFGPDLARTWLAQNGFDHDYIPYQWIPFFIPWSAAVQQDPVLHKLQDLRTIVSLPGVSTDQALEIQRLLT